MGGNKQGSHITGDGKQELQFLRFHNMYASPVVGSLGQFYYNTSNFILRIFNGTIWENILKTASSMTPQKLMVGNNYEMVAITPPTNPSFVKVDNASIASTKEYIEVSEINPSGLTSVITPPGVTTKLPNEKAVVDYVAVALTAGKGIADDISFEYQNIVNGSIQEYVLDLDASFAYDILSATFKSDNTITGISIKINNIAVVGLTLLNTGNTKSTATASSLNRVNIGNTVTLVTNGVADVATTKLIGKIRIKRV